MSKQSNTATVNEHPLAGQLMTGADTVIQVLVDEGVKTVFGYSGGAILPIYDAVFRYNETHKLADGRSPIPLVVPAAILREPLSGEDLEGLSDLLDMRMSI